MYGPSEFNPHNRTMTLSPNNFVIYAAAPLIGGIIAGLFSFALVNEKDLEEPKLLDKEEG